MEVDPKFHRASDVLSPEDELKDRKILKICRKTVLSKREEEGLEETMSPIESDTCRRCEANKEISRDLAVTFWHPAILNSMEPT